MVRRRKGGKGKEKGKGKGAWEGGLVRSVGPGKVVRKVNDSSNLYNFIIFIVLISNNQLHEK